jgi:hypothetical protein
MPCGIGKHLGVGGGNRRQAEPEQGECQPAHEGRREGACPAPGPPRPCRVQECSRYGQGHREQPPGHHGEAHEACQKPEEHVDAGEVRAVERARRNPEPIAGRPRREIPGQDAPGRDKYRAEAQDCGGDDCICRHLLSLRILHADPPISPAAHGDRVLIASLMSFDAF